MEDKVQVKKSLWYRIIRIFLRVLLAVIILLVVLVLILNIPTVQTFIAGKFIKSIREKTGTEVSLGSLKIALPNTLKINELFLRDKNADTMLYLHSLSVDVSLSGLLKNEVAVKSLTLENVVANIHRKTPESTFNFQFLVDLFVPDTTVKSDTATKPRKPWLIKVNDIKLHHIRAAFSDARGGTDLQVDLGDFVATLKDIDLNKKKIDINEILLKNTSVSVAISPKSENNGVQRKEDTLSDMINPVSESQSAKSVFLALNISADRLTIENTGFMLDNNSSPKLPEGMDYGHMNFSKLNAVLHNISIDSSGYRAEFKNVSVAESCGLNLKSLSADAAFTDGYAAIKNMQIETEKSKISGNMSLGYASFNTFLADLWNSETILDLNSSCVNANEALLFVPFLGSNPYISQLKNTDILVSAKASGKINDLNIENLELTLLDKTAIKSNCRLKGIPDLNSMTFDASVDNFSSTLNNIEKFVDPSVLAGLNLPASFEIKAKAKGKLNSVSGNIEFKSDYGLILAETFYQTARNTHRDTLHVKFEAKNIEAGKILNDTLPGRASFIGYASGSGISINKISGLVHLEVQEAEYNSYTYKDVIIDGNMAENILSATASSTDTNLSFKLVANADFREVKQKYSAQLDLESANLHRLNFTERDISVSTNLEIEAYYAGLKNAKVNLNLANTILATPEKKLPVKSFEIQAGSFSDSIRVIINSDLLDGNITANITPIDIGKTLQSAYSKYFGLKDTSQVKPGQNLAFSINVHLPEEVLKLISPEFELLNLSKFEGEYKTDNNTFKAELKIPNALYSNIQLDSLNLSINGRDESLLMEMNIEAIAYDTLKIENIRISEQVDKGIILSNIGTYDETGKELYLFKNQVEFGKDFFNIRFLPGGLVLDGSPWKVEEGNIFEMRNNLISASKFVLTKDQQSAGFITNSDNHKLVFENFAIQNLLNVVKSKDDKRVLKGNLQGDITFPSSVSQKYINANIAIKELHFQDSLVGDLFLDIKTADDRMELNSSFESDLNKIIVKGDVQHLSGNPVLDLTTWLDIKNLNRFQRFSLGYLSEMSGKINGEVNVKGPLKKPEIKGFVGFEETTFRINSLNFLARIKDEKINLDKAGAHFSDFAIEDADFKKLIVDGDILTSDYSKIGFDLHLVTKDFQPINSTVKDNPLFYGRMSLDADLMLKGDIQNPKLTAAVKINKSTDLTYALPGSELQLVTSEGVVEFIDPLSENDSLIALQGDYLTDSIISHLNGLNLALNLEIDPDAKFTVDIDPKSGDFLTVSGGAKLNIAADANGKQSITGVYEVKNGVYQLSFYGLVKKTFTIAPGSKISWSGKPMDADLDITAEYEVRTSSVSLVANETAEMSDAEKQTFNKRLPYMVKLNIKGFLAEPKIGFNISLPEKYLLTYPLVATKLALLNSEENVDDLNKQVFALLVTGSFMADSPQTSSGSSPTNIASTAARNSVNGILADQLNNVSSKYITGVDVNFGLTSYEDFEASSSDIRTEMDIQVSKKLFHDRITVEAMGTFDLEGEKSNTTTSTSKKMTNEFAIIYQLSESGEYKLRAYYEDAYDLFDGDISYSGIALIFEKEFDTLKRKKKLKSE